MHHLGDFCDPCTSRPCHKRLNIESCEFAHPAAQILGLLRCPKNHPRGSISCQRLSLQSAVFQNKRSCRQRTAQHGQQSLWRTGLFKKIKRALAHRLHGHRDVTLPSQQNHRQLGIHASRMRQEVKAVASGHAHIRKHSSVKLGADMIFGFNK